MKIEDVMQAALWYADAYAGNVASNLTVQTKHELERCIEVYAKDRYGQMPSDMRDQFAMHIIQGMVSRPNSAIKGYHKTNEDYAAAAYEGADAMMQIRRGRA